MIALLTSVTTFAQTNFYSKATGDITDVATWGTNTDGTGTSPTNFTAANQIFNFRNRVSETLTANWTVSGAGSKVIVGDGITSTTLNTSTFTIAGVFDVADNSVLNIGSNSTSLTMGVLSSGSSVVYSGDINQSVRAGSYQNLTLNGASLMRLKTASGPISVAGTLSVQNNNTFVLGANALSGSFTTAGTGVITTTNTSATPLPANLLWTQTVDYNAASNQTVVTGVYENLFFTISGTTSRTRTASGDVTVNNQLALDVTGTGILTFALGNNRLINGSAIVPTKLGTGANTTRVITTTRSTLALPAGFTWPFVVQYNAAMDLIGGTYENLTIGTTGLKTATGNVTVTETLTSTGTLNMGSNTLSGAFTQTGTGTITTAGTMPSGKTWTSTTINYNASGAQSVAPGTYNALNISGGDRTITGTLQIAGAFTTGAGAITTAGSTIELVGSGTQTITITGQTALSFNNLLITTGTTKTFSSAAAAITINGNLDIAAGTTLVMGTNRLIVTGGSPALLGTGTLNTTCVLANPLSSGLTWPYSVGFNAGVNDQLPAGTFQNLSITGNGTTAAQGNITVVNNLTYTGALNMGIYQLSGIAGTISGTSTLTTANTSANPIPSGKSWVGTVVYNAADNQTIADALSYNSLTISGGGSFIKTASGNLTINTTLTVAASTILDMSTFQLVSATTYTNSGTTRTQNTSANPIPSMPATIGGTVEYNAAGNQTVVPNTHTNLNISGGGNRNLTGTINVTGTFTATSGTIVGGTSSFNLTGGTQTLNLGAGGSFNDFSVLGTGTKTITAGTGNLVVNGDLTINSTLAMTTNQLQGGLTATAGTGTLTTTHFATALPIPASSTWGFTINFAGNGQTVPEGIYTNLIISGNNTTKTASGDVTVNNNLSFNGNGNTTLDMSTFRLINIGGTISGTGIIRTQNTSATPIPAAKTWTQTVLYNGTGAQTVVHGDYITLNIAGGDRTISTLGDINVTGTFIANTDPAVYTTTGSTINFTGEAQTLTFILTNPFPFHNVSFTSAVPSTKTVAGVLDVENELDIDANTTLSLGTAPLQGNLLTMTGTGKIITANTTAAVPAGLTWPYTIEYFTNAANQAIIQGTYNNLTIRHASTAANRNRAATGDITVNNTLTLETQNTGNLNLVMAGNRLIDGGSLSLDVINGGGDLAINTAYTNPLLTALPVGLNWTDIAVSYIANAVNNTQLISAGTYGSLSTTGASPKTATGNITLNGIADIGGSGVITLSDLTIGNDGEFIALNNSSIVITGTINNIGKFDVGTNNNTVTYTGNNQTIVAPNGDLMGYRNLIIDGTGTANFTGTECAIRGTFTVNQPNISFGTTNISFIGDLTPQNITGTNPPSNFTTLFKVDKLAQTDVVQIAQNTTFSGGLDLNNGVLNIQNNNIGLSGTLSSSTTGFIRFDGGNDITITGTTSGNIRADQSTPGTTNRVRNITMNSTGTVALQNPFLVSSNGVVTISNGTLNANNNLTLLSTANDQSAQIGQISGTGNITGNLSVQRFVSSAAGRKWRFMGSPVTTTNFISNNWQQQMYIAGSGTGGDCATDVKNSNGFDVTATNAPSMFTWNTATQSWASIPNTTSTNLQTGVGYRTFIRGSRNLGCVSLTNPSTPADNLTLSANGLLAIGTQTLTCASSANDWTLLANPYQAKVDLEALTLTNVNDIIYVFNPSQGANGAYNEYDISTSTGTGSMTRYLSPGQAFFVQTLSSASASIEFTESAKAVSETAGALFKNKITDHILKIQLQNQQGETLNEVTTYFHPQASWGRDAIDGAKMSFGAGQIATYTRYSSDRLAVNRLATMPALSVDTVFIDVNVGSATSGTWNIVLAGANSFASHYQLSLYDAFTQTTQDLRINPNYTYTINSQAASRNAGRLMIIIQNTSTTLPVSLIRFEAEKITDQVLLSWTTATERNSKSFEIERSLTGEEFETIGSVEAKGNSSRTNHYTFTDKYIATMSPTIFYRLKMLDKDGSYEYSQIRRINMNADELVNEGLQLYPVPANNELTIDNKSGIVINKIVIYDAMGRKLYSANAKDATVKIDISEYKAGVYMVEVINADGAKNALRFIKE
jgi:hypothetical protein